MNRSTRRQALLVLFPVSVVMLAVAASAILFSLPADFKTVLAIVLVATLAVIALIAAWQQAELVRRYRAIKKELVQRTDDLRSQTERLTALHDLALRLRSPLRMEEG